MRLGARLIVTVFAILLCSFPLCSGRKGRQRNLTPKGKKLPPICPTNCSSCGHNTNPQQTVFNVDDFGAKANVNDTDNFQAFKNAWDSACNSSASATILVPEGNTYSIKQINFTGPCQSDISMEIQGTIIAFSEMYDFPKRLWIKFENVANLVVAGGGTFFGHGEVWWKNTCKIKKTKPCISENAPSALTFSKCTNLRVSNLKTLDPQQIHIVIQDCDGVEASNLLVVAPEKSPNTDGIHITRSSNVKVHDSTIGTGDDCISIVSGTKNVEVSNIVCGPGHGISIGSLGVDNSASSVSNVHVTGAVLTGTTNGARIKTWQGGSGYAMNIVYDNIVMKNVSNPIIIDQNYCDKGKDCQKAASGVQIQNVVFSDISGTSATKDAITLDCSESVPCRNIILENVKLSAVKAGPKVDAVCTNINQTLLINTSPTCF